MTVLCRLLAPSPALSDLIRDIGVEEVTHSGFVRRFLLPDLGTVSEEDRRKLLQHMKEHWQELKGDGELVGALKEVSGHGLPALRRISGTLLVSCSSRNLGLPSNRSPVVWLANMKLRGLEF